jgi:16S rRNA (guanine966-N2)-methyltransferase
MRIIAGEWRGRTIRAPAGRDVRPTGDRVREAWFGAIGPRVRGLQVVDLFAGSGALGLEALSRGAAHVVFVERARPALRSLDANIDTLGVGDRTTVVRSDVFGFLRGNRQMFDLALADPPYDRGFAVELFDRMAAEPFAREIWVEHRSAESMPPLEGLTARRYGDTTLSIWEPPDAVFS